MIFVKVIDCFENDWLKKYPFLREFSINSCLTDIIYQNSIWITSGDKEAIAGYLLGYIRDQKDRFIYMGNKTFLVRAKVQGTN